MKSRGSAATRRHRAQQELRDLERLPPLPSLRGKSWDERALIAREAHRRVQAAAELRRLGGNAISFWEQTARAYHRVLAEVWPPDFVAAVNRLAAKQPADREPLLQFLEADPFFVGSGYAKERLMRQFKRVELTPEEKARLYHIVLGVIDRRDGREVRDYCRLAAAQLDSAPLRQALSLRAKSDDPNVRRRAGWALNALQMINPRADGPGSPERAAAAADRQAE